MTTTIPGLTPRLIASVREALAIRDSAAADLQACPESRQLTEWAADRRNDLRHTNDWIARQAKLLVMTPEELIVAATTIKPIVIHDPRFGTFYLNKCKCCGEDVECRKSESDYTCDDCLPPEVEYDEQDFGRPGDWE